MNIRLIVGNALFAALYIAVTALIAPFGFTNIQFRVSEVFNHLIVFNSKYIYGIVIGVLLANFLLSPMGVYDLVLGVGQTVLSLLTGIFLKKWIKGTIPRMIALTCIFSFTMFMIAILVNISTGLPFLFGWATLAISEFIVMAIGIPVMLKLNDRLHFSKLIEGSSQRSSLS